MDYNYVKHYIDYFFATLKIQSQKNLYYHQTNSSYIDTTLINRKKTAQYDIMIINETIWLYQPIYIVLDININRSNVTLLLDGIDIAMKSFLSHIFQSDQSIVVYTPYHQTGIVIESLWWRNQLLYICHTSHVSAWYQSIVNQTLWDLYYLPPSNCLIVSDMLECDFVIYNTFCLHHHTRIVPIYMNAFGSNYWGREYLS
jgi:hypothetical protein